MGSIKANDMLEIRRVEMVKREMAQAEDEP